jgi:hypothetical protein
VFPRTLLRSSSPCLQFRRRAPCPRLLRRPPGHARRPGCPLRPPEDGARRQPASCPAARQRSTPFAAPTPVLLLRSGPPRAVLLRALTTPPPPPRRKVLSLSPSPHHAASSGARWDSSNSAMLNDRINQGQKPWTLPCIHNSSVWYYCVVFVRGNYGQDQVSLLQQEGVGTSSQS